MNIRCLVFIDEIVLEVDAETRPERLIVTQKWVKTTLSSAKAASGTKFAPNSPLNTTVQHITQLIILKYDLVTLLPALHVFCKISRTL